MSARGPRISDPGCCHFVVDLPLVAAGEKTPLVLLGKQHPYILRAE